MRYESGSEALLPSLNGEHLVVDLPHGELPSEDGSHREISSVPRVARRHHVLRAEHLPREVGYCLRSRVSHVDPVIGLSVHHPDENCPRFKRYQPDLLTTKLHIQNFSFFSDLWI